MQKAQVANNNMTAFNCELARATNHAGTVSHGLAAAAAEEIILWYTTDVNDKEQL